MNLIYPEALRLKAALCAAKHVTRAVTVWTLQGGEQEERIRKQLVWLVLM